MAAPLMPNEAERLDALWSFGVLDTPPEPDYDDLTRLASTICCVPIALVSLVDPCRQWFKSRCGLDVSETPRDIAFCSHAILRNDLFIVEDATADERFKENPLVTGEPHIRFYAGSPLTTPDGHNIGTLCVLDRVRRTLSDMQRDALRVLSRQVVAQLLLRRQIERSKVVEADLRASEQRFRAFMDNSPAMAYMKGADGKFLYVNEPLAKQFQRPVSEWIGKTDHDFFAAEFADKYRDHDRKVLAGRDAVQFSETSPGPDGGTTHWRSYKFPLTDSDGRRLLAGMSVDVTAETKAEAALRESEQRFRSVVEELAEGVVLLDRLSRKVLRSNRAFRDLLGYTAAELAELTQYDFVAHDRDDIDAKMVQIENRGRMSIGFRKYRRKDGLVFDVTVSGSVLTLDGRAVLCLVVQDMTDRKRAEDALRTSEAKFRSTVDRLAEGVFMVDASTGRFMEANVAFLDMLGYTMAEFLALDSFDIVAGESPDVHSRNARDMLDKLAREGRCDVGRRRFRRKDGSTIPVDIRVTVVPNGGAGIHAVVVRDVTEQVAYETRLFEYQSELEDANTRLKTLATTDGLTGVKNRAAFNEKLAEEFERASRHGRPLSVILMDVDYFKLFNDTFGHPAGDAVLRRVAATIQRTARSIDTVARYGGEEFAVILPDTDFSGAMVLAERCRRAVASEPWELRPITVSVGVATFTAATADAETLVQEADEALYRSKQAGRNRVNHSCGASTLVTPTRT